MRLRWGQLRGVGGNGWRTSHNPPEVRLLDITDRLGIVVMVSQSVILSGYCRRYTGLQDENRVFATTVTCPGCGGAPEYHGDPVQDMSDLVARDKLHASVIWWSFVSCEMGLRYTQSFNQLNEIVQCNEGGCGDGRLHPADWFRNASYAGDGSRPVGANVMAWNSDLVRLLTSSFYHLGVYVVCVGCPAAGAHQHDRPAGRDGLLARSGRLHG
jgi:hypothetical protein